jgi:hypothetical protein
MRKILSATLAVSLLAAGHPAFAQTRTTAVDKPTTVVVEGQKRPKRGNTHTWVRGESAHFVIYSDAAPADAQALVARLERFHSLLRHIAGLDDTPEVAGPKLEFYYLAQGDSLSIADPVKPDYAIGLYKGCEEGVQAYGTDMYYRPEAKTALELQPENEGLVYLFEAYAHHFLNVNDSHRTPLWFIDGFAHYVATARFEGDETLVGMAPEAYASYLKLISQDIDYHLDYKDVLADVDAKPGYDAKDSANIRNEFGARAWILTHWIESSPQNRAKFTAYLKAVDGGTPSDAAFQSAFGLTPSRLDTALWTYLKGHHVMAIKMNVSVPTPPEIPFETLPLSADKLLMWQSALKGCTTPAYGAKLLANIRAEAPKYPESDLAQGTLDRAEILWGDPQRVLPALTQAAAAKPGDFDSQYLLGRAELAVAQSATGDARAQAFAIAKQAFLKAADIDSNSAPNIYAYYRAEILSYDQPNEAALAAAISAWQLEPEIDSYALVAGLAYAYQGRTEDALHVLHTVADDPHGRSLAGIARTWIGRLKAGAAKAEIAAALKAGVDAPEGGQVHWTLANHAAVDAQVKAYNDEMAQEMMNDAINSGTNNDSGL